MRPLYLALPVSLLLLAPYAGAQGNYPATDEQTPSEPISSVQVTAPVPEFHPWSDELEAVSGKYAMSNGSRLNVEPASQGIVARIDRQRTVRLVALSPDKYVSSDGNVAMLFHRGEAGDEMLMSYVPDSNVAQVIVVKATLAQR